MRHALVTGGTSPIGAAICRRLAADGLHVTIHTHARQAEAEILAALIRSGGGSAATLTADLTDVPGTEAALAPLLQDPVPQILVHNAGTHDDVPLAGMSERQWRSVIDVSLTGFFAITRPLLLPMMATRWGRVVAMSSLAGLIGAVKSLAREVASRGVTVNAVAPGLIQSPAVDAVLDARRIAEIVPMKRAGTVEEVADLVGFLVSDRAGYISGQTISINGAMA